MAEDSLKALEEGQGGGQDNLEGPKVESSGSSRQPSDHRGGHDKTKTSTESHIERPHGKPSRWHDFLDRQFNRGEAERWDEQRKFETYGPPPAKDERSELEVFQGLVGIHFLREGGGILHKDHRKALGHERPVPPMTDIFFPSSAARDRFRNRGLYNRCLAQDQKNRVMYGLSNYVISFLYLLQILIAAAITGLSAYESSAMVTLTVLGAINTVLAGILAWLNGQGMPTRFRRARDQYREVVKAIESAERLFSEINYMDWSGNSRPNPFKVRDELEKMYEEARSDQESNYPDTQEGPNKNQMEGTKRVLQGQIAEYKTEKNKQIDRFNDAQKDLEKLKLDLESERSKQQKNALKLEEQLEKSKNDLDQARRDYNDLAEVSMENEEALEKSSKQHKHEMERLLGYFAQLKRAQAESQKTPENVPTEERYEAKGPELVEVTESMPLHAEPAATPAPDPPSGGPRRSSNKDDSDDDMGFGLFDSDDETKSHAKKYLEPQQETFVTAALPAQTRAVRHPQTLQTTAAAALPQEKKMVSDLQSSPNTGTRRTASATNNNSMSPEPSARSQRTRQRRQPRWLTRSLDND